MSAVQHQVLPEPQQALPCYNFSLPLFQAFITCLKEGAFLFTLSPFHIATQASEVVDNLNALPPLPSSGSNRNTSLPKVPMSRQPSGKGQTDTECLYVIEVSLAVCTSGAHVAAALRYGAADAV